MKRHNLFSQHHKALKAMLYDAALSLQQTDFSVEEESGQLIQKLMDITRLFDTYAQVEDLYILAAIDPFEPSMADAFRQEQAAGLKLSQALRFALAALGKAEGEQTLGSAYMTFMNFQLTLLARVDEGLTPVLGRYFTDRELKTLEQEMAFALPANLQGLMMRWKMKGINNGEAVRWLKEAENSAPEIDFQQLFTTAEKELPPHRFRQVIELFTEGVMLA